VTQKESTILIVDDQPANLKVLLSLLKLHYFQIRVAASGEQALIVLSKNLPDIILLDVMMPGMDGFETCQRIKANKATADIPVIFMTALDRIEDKVAGFEAGGVDYITKPFQQVEVLARVNTHISLRQRELELKETKNELFKQNKRLEQLSIIDDLTGLYNRRHLNRVLKQEYQRSKRYTTDLSCLLLDLDHFKQVNDTYGHEFGDTVLKKFSSILSESVRDSDYVFRYGGEEVLILLPQANIEDARDTGEKIRMRIAAEEFSDGTFSTPITVSIGGSSFQKHLPEKPHELVTFADKALYMAKNNGRNQVVIHP
jgi:diguanylate cyclase (GGDEF)-like protein